jgi:hypothetical protein
MTMGPQGVELLDCAMIVQGGDLPAELEIALDRASDFAKAEKAANTRRAYAGDFVAFRAWCAARGVSALPATAEIVAAFLGAEADRGTSRHRRLDGGSPRSAMHIDWLDSSQRKYRILRKA